MALENAIKRFLKRVANANSNHTFSPMARQLILETVEDFQNALKRKRSKR